MDDEGSENSWRDFLVNADLFIYIDLDHNVYDGPNDFMLSKVISGFGHNGSSPYPLPPWHLPAPQGSDPRGHISSQSASSSCSAPSGRLY
jgi:hypothetical protein